MKQPGTLLKVAAVVSSMLLLGGFVGCRSGAFNRLRETNSPTAQQPSTEKQDAEPTIMPGTKSITPTRFFGETPAEKTNEVQLDIPVTPTSKFGEPASLPPE
jgi:hypothetical protein